MTAPESQSRHWSGSARMRGGRFGVWFFLTALKLLGLHLTYALAVPVAAYFTIASPDVKAAMAYHRRVFGRVPWWKRRWLVFRHFLSFGMALIDRTAILAGQTRRFTFSFEGEHHLRQAVAEGRGVLLLTAHVGNWEAAGALLSRLDVPINLTGFDKEAPGVRAMLSKASKAQVRLIPLTGSPTDAIALVAAMRQGEVVAMLGDRAYGSTSARIPFLGGTAPFPVGVYVLAATAGAPLVSGFSLREPGGHYRFFGFPPQRLQLPPHRQRDDYLRDCAAQFARDLEFVVRRDPLQWYNFFPFWDDSDPPAAPATGSRVQAQTPSEHKLADAPVGTPRPQGAPAAHR